MRCRFLRDAAGNRKRRRFPCCRLSIRPASPGTWRRYRKVQQHSDKPTLDFLAWLKEQPLLKAILCGHCHRYYEERFSGTAVLYAVDATYHGGVQAVYFE